MGRVAKKRLKEIRSFLFLAVPTALAGISLSLLSDTVKSEPFLQEWQKALHHTANFKTSWCVSLAILAVLTFAFLAWLYQYNSHNIQEDAPNDSNSKKLNLWSKTLWPFLNLALPIVGAGISWNLLTDTIKSEPFWREWSNVLYPNHPSGFWWSMGISFAVSLIFAVICSYWLYKSASNEYPMRTLKPASKSDKSEAYRVLIMLISYNSAGSFSGDSLTLTKKDEPPKTITLTNDLDRDIAAIQNDRWNWEQVMRGLKQHFKTVKRLYLIGSSRTIGEDGKEKVDSSFEQLEDCGQLLSRYSTAYNIELHPNPVDFENLDKVYEAVDQCVKRALEDFEEEEVIIDATGGQKTTSIAAAMYTLHTKLKFQYVNNNHIVQSYEVIYEPSREPSI